VIQGRERRREEKELFRRAYKEEEGRKDKG
jgi:hypothetical protein